NVLFAFVSVTVAGPDLVSVPGPVNWPPIVLFAVAFRSNVPAKLTVPSTHEPGDAAERPIVSRPAPGLVIDPASTGALIASVPAPTVTIASPLSVNFPVPLIVLTP